MEGRSPDPELLKRLTTYAITRRLGTADIGSQRFRELWAHADDIVESIARRLYCGGLNGRKTVHALEAFDFFSQDREYAYLVELFWIRMPFAVHPERRVRDYVVRSIVFDSGRLRRMVANRPERLDGALELPSSRESVGVLKAALAIGVSDDVAADANAFIASRQREVDDSESG